MPVRTVVAVALLAAATTFSPARAAPVNIVQVRNNSFTAQETRVARGESVTWVAVDGEHTVTAVDRRFSFPAGGGTLRRGDVVSWRFDGDETVEYVCLIHGPRMRGVVIVGEGSALPPPPQPSFRTVPSAGYPTIASALTGAPPGTIIDVMPGDYHYAVTVTVPDVTIRGAGAAPSDVVIDGDGLRYAGITVRAHGVRIENLTVREHGGAGLVFDGADRFTAARVTASDNAAYGVHALGATRGTIDGVVAEGSALGIAIEDCDPCAITVDRASVFGNGVGIAGANASDLSVSRSDIRGNGSGIVLRGIAHMDRHVQRAARISDNTIVDNVAPAGSADAVGAGIWLASAWEALVEGNRVAGHRYGIVVTAAAAPSIADRVVRNIVEGSSIADIAWDGMGADVCFADNTDGDGATATSDPPFAEDLYPCAAPHTVGVPWPVVQLRLLAR